ncbi:hypothetical protein [Agriterribacter sp.]|uniref:hypothetical protein n=1 Tax=Agriterribacter sp. TaxID=2821509 RepID=UPI002C085000|nr:hypothetical protein [Agriterribacter sp.]HTN09130.1 hypothetical protein [Agriterribacter sp.]
MIKVFIPLFFLTITAYTGLPAQEQLPVGTHPPAIEYEHFPNRVYALVWRNWNLVEPERMAQTIDCGTKDIIAVAESMGLPPAQSVSPDFKKRIYITVIRRNWHLLPYDQLLTLLDMTADELEFALKEDDFLFVKLGNLKPMCSKIIYTKPDKKTLARAKEIKQLVQQHFKASLARPTAPRFAFVKDLQSTEGLPKKETAQYSNEKGLRFIYSYFGIFGDPLIDTLHDPYPDGLLARLASKGVNGIWMHVVLNQLAPGGNDFPEFGEGHLTRLHNLRRIVERAKQYGISVYLYMNEPRAMPLSFFKNRQEMMGTQEGAFAALCTSNEKVLNWISHSLAYVFKQAPELGGVFTITASENFTSCASHGNQKACPRCSRRKYADIIAGVNEAMANGVHAGNANARVIAWDWGWHNHGDAPDVIAKLPKSVWLMSVSEWAKPIERGGIPSQVGEYSISAVGPGPRATRHWALAKQAGLKTVAKVQFNNTWELSAVPWLPVSDIIAEHASNLAKMDTDGLMLSWSLGGYPSPNLEIAQAFAKNPAAKPETVLNELALQLYGNAAAPFARQAWTAFSNAFREFPYGGGVVYNAPQQYGPANLLFAEPTGYASTMVGFPYDDLKGWRSIYPAAVFAGQFDKVANGWKEGLGYFKKAIEVAEPGKRAMAKADMGIATAAWLHFASVANQVRFVMARDSIRNHHLPSAEKQIQIKAINNILNNEITLARTLFEITQSDSRIGFEASNQYYYVPQDLIEKVINCEFVRTQLGSM